ncbi:restriction endonuclease subunit S [Dickeya solani]|uniref:Restriction endonuclease subunit S n=1 Tax=Dickeya solani TaxID=1089444 RepID=A0AAX4F3Y2_9GAMM|nr:restriction endonuclease subunit S [Dickeya solani]WOA54176.1 restriction endonuclease subunit S [Dickeya solani]
MAKYKAYPEYKDSGVEWLGEIPEHWAAIRYKFCTQRVVVGIAEAATHAYANCGVPIIRSTNIRENRLDIRGIIYIQDFFAKQNSSKFLFENDIITIRTGFPGVSAVIPASLDKSQCFTNLISTPREHYSPEFLAYYLNSSQGKSYFELLGWGSAQKNISVPILQDFPLAFPVQNEQLKIVDFIVHETAKIDNLIEKQQQLIELLKEKRQAVISHAVTKGLDPNVPMKDSGVEWLGEVPEHWIVSGFKKYLSSIVDYRGKTPNKTDDGILLVTARNIKKGMLDYTLSQEFIAVSDYETVMSRGLPDISDVLFTTEAPLGEVANVDRTDIALAQRVIKFKGMIHRLDNYYLKYFIMSSAFQQSLNLYSSGSTAQGIKAERFVYLRKLLPPINEQKEIVDFLDQEIKKIDMLVEQQFVMLYLLQERRTALISAAVTGKIDVRDWVAPDSSEMANIEGSPEVNA